MCYTVIILSATITKHYVILYLRFCDIYFLFDSIALSIWKFSDISTYKNKTRVYSIVTREIYNNIHRIFFHSIRYYVFLFVFKGERARFPSPFDTALRAFKRTQSIKPLIGRNNGFITFGISNVFMLCKPR